MAGIEYQKDLDAFKKLHMGLVKRYNGQSEKMCKA